MKKTLLIFTVVGSMLFTACDKEEALEHQDHDSNKMMQIMHQMMARMDTLHKTNDPDIDFARMARIHHQGAIDMSNLELQEGKEDTMKRVAQKIIAEQEAEIQQLTAILATLSVDNNDPAFTMEQMENMEKGSLVADQQHYTGDIDNDFATLMIVHHQGIIDNASAYLHHGNNEELIEMAKMMIMTQTEEIKELSSWLIANRR